MMVVRDEWSKGSLLGMRYVRRYRRTDVVGRTGLGTGLVNDGSGRDRIGQSCRVPLLLGGRIGKKGIR
jgi:hypothetical protein